MKNLITKLKSLDKGTIIRTILFYVAIANQLIAVIGSTSFADAAWYQWASFGLTAIAAIASWWYNQDLSEGAILVRDIFDAVNDGKLSKEEVEKFKKEHDVTPAE